MTRDEFRAAVFARDGQRCVACHLPAQDAHHLMERRLFPDGGYDPDNGVSLCADCHLAAEATVLTPAQLRSAAHVTRVVLPPHLYPDTDYDKWGNVSLSNGLMLPGELFDDPSVQKALTSVLHRFDARVKYPRTWHLPWSHPTKDDRTLTDAALAAWADAEVVVTEKMDGENTTLYRDYVHARSIDYDGHASRSWVKALQARLGPDLPHGWRICGENCWAQHSIHYDALPGYFLMFSLWEGLTCHAWDETVEWAALLGVPTVPVLYRGLWAELVRDGHEAAHGRLMRATRRNVDHATDGTEGYVVRPASAFRLRDFPRVVGKFVRADHVQTHGHWMRHAVVKNQLCV